MEFENKKLRSVAEAAARIMMGEKALHPNQQKLDVHEPEKDKLTSDDFKKLRTMKKEETMHEESCECGSCPSDKDMKKEEVGLEEARSVNLKAGKVGNEVHMSKWMQDHTKKNKSTGSSDAWNEYHGKGTVTHLGKDGHVKVKSHDTGKTHKFSYYGKGIGPDSEDMAVHGSKDDIHSLRNVKEEVDLDEGKMGQLSADLKDLSHDDFHKEYGKPKSHYDPSNFKKPVQKGKEMDRAKSLAQRAMASMKKEEVEEIEEMFPGTPEYEKKYGKAPQDMKKGEKKKTTQGEMEKTGKGVVHRRKFSEMVESYTEGGVKGLFKTLAEEPTSAEFDAQLDDAKKRAAGTKKQAEVSKPAVQAVQNEEVESVEEQTHTTVEFIDYNDVNGVKYAEIDLAERKLTDAETEKKEDTVKSMKKNLSGFKERYGKDAKSVMYATATANAKKSS